MSLVTKLLIEVSQVTSRHLAYSQSIVNLLSESPKRFSHLVEKLQVSNKVLSYNLRALQSQGIIETFSAGPHKYYKLAAKERVADLKQELTRFIKDMPSQTFMNPNLSLFVFTTEAHTQLTLYELPKIPPSSFYMQYRSLSSPENVANQLVTNRINNDKFHIFLRFYGKLVLLGYFLELKRPGWMRKSFSIRTIDATTRVPSSSPFRPELNPQGLELQGIWMALKRIKQPRTPVELWTRLHKGIESIIFDISEHFLSLDYIMWRTFGYLMERGKNFIGFQEGEALNEFSRDMIHRSLYRDYELMVKREELWRYKKKGIPIEEKWSFQKLKKDLRNQKEMFEILSDVMKPIEMIYVWAPYLKSSYLDKLRASEEAREFDTWLNKLKKGDFDHRYWLFTEDSVEKALVDFLRILRQRPQQLPFDFKLDVEPFMQTSFLFYNHPRGKSIEFYSEILEGIKKRKEFAKQVLAEIKR
jgi:DNA-binding Lrp family transcriptional regulator